MASSQELPGALASRRPEELILVALHHKEIPNSLRTKSPANKHKNNPSSDGRAPKLDRLNADRFSIHLTVTCSMLSILLVALISFLYGTAVQIILLSKGDSHLILTTSSTANTIHGGMSLNEHTRLNSGRDAGQIISTEVKHPLSKRGDEDKDNNEDINHCKEAPHLPSGEHLLVDVRGVNSRLLNSDERIATIATTMVDLTKECEIALLSYHCYSHVSMRVSCFGVSSEGHVSIRAWPEEGVIIIDLFRFGASSNMVKILPFIKKLFIVPCLDLVEGTDEDLPEPKLIWSHKLRGFREGFYGYERYDNPLESDVGEDVLRMHYLDMKEVLISEETEFQHVDIYEVINPRVTSLASYGRSFLHSEMYRPDKLLYLDGVQQSSLYGEAAYHEALVHPSMITHPNPRRVAIIGGGEGATLREVLKHNTVDEVVMVEIDGKLVDMCREHLPEWSDCTDLVGSEDSCFDDYRASILFEDAFVWFIDNFGNGENKREKLDLIIMDALDPDKFVEIVGALYKNDQFVRSLYNALADDGVVSFHLMSMFQMPNLTRTNAFIFS
jgi:spermidine synthase/S-adenosylmethionine/arginine decarboxylase-like enzyme